MTQSRHESERPQGPERPATLSAADAEALDAVLGELVEAAPTQERRQGVADVLELLGRCPAEDPPADLTARTLERIAAARSAEAVVAGQVGPMTGRSWRWGELLATAAVLLIGFSLLIPVLDRNRADARRIACASNLHVAATSMARYAQDFAGVMPRGNTRPGSPWWQVGRQTSDQDLVTSNSANLYLLARHGYAAAQDLACPDNPHQPAKMAADARDWPHADAVSFSYQNQYTPRSQPLVRPASARGSAAILADRNPLFHIRQDRRAGITRTNLPDHSPSLFHGLGGHNVVFTGGEVQWTPTALVRRQGGSDDNIWLLDNVSRYDGDEYPRSDDDTFLVP